MKTIGTLLGCLIGSGLFAGHALAQSALVHIQGEAGSHEAYFANFGVVLDRTSMDKVLGPIRVRQLDTTIVYEHPDKPEFSELRLQFECVVKHAYDGKTIPKQPAFDAPVKVRVAEGSWKLRREDIKSEDLPAGDWRTSSSPVLLKLQKIACNEDVMRSAVIKAAKAKNMDLFVKDIETIGLPSDLQLVGQQVSSEYLEFAWAVLWNGATRPDPTGKWSRRPTKKETEEFRAKMEQLQKQYDHIAAGITPTLEVGIKEMDAESTFKKQASEIRGGRQLSRNEFHMLTVWEGKTETDVGATMGAPIVSTAGTLRFLSYGKEFDNRVTVGNRQGAVWEEGLYEHCNVQFVMHPDSKNVSRVVDVRIWANSNRIGQVMFACDGLLEVPK